MTIMDFITTGLGFYGTVAFAVASLPLAIRSVCAGKALVQDAFLIWMVWTGALAMYWYITLIKGFDWIILADYFFTIVDWMIVCYLYHFPVKKLYLDPILDPSMYKEEDFH